MVDIEVVGAEEEDMEKGRGKRIEVEEREMRCGLRSWSREKRVGGLGFLFYFIFSFFLLCWAREIVPEVALVRKQPKFFISAVFLFFSFFLKI